MISDLVAAIPPARRPSGSYAYILAAICAGAILGVAAPGIGAAMKPVGDMFIAAVKMIITPVIFLTIVTGIAGSKDISELGRIALKALGPNMFVRKFNC